VAAADRRHPTAAPLPIKDRIIVGVSGGDSGVLDWIARSSKRNAIGNEEPIERLHRGRTRRRGRGCHLPPKLRRPSTTAFH
jgi:hypothetical protein